MKTGRMMFPTKEEAEAFCHTFVDTHGPEAKVNLHPIPDQRGWLVSTTEPSPENEEDHVHWKDREVDFGSIGEACGFIEGLKYANAPNLKFSKPMDQGLNSGWVVHLTDERHATLLYHTETQAVENMSPLSVGPDLTGEEAIIDLLNKLYGSVELIRDQMTAPESPGLFKEQKVMLDAVKAEKDRIEELYSSIGARLNQLRTSIGAITCGECGDQIGLGQPKSGNEACEVCNEFKVALHDSWGD
jgi:hypothetical protein